MIAGLDVSKWQGSVDWSRVVREMPGVRFVVAKATEGVGYVDPQWHANAANVRANGLVLGSYHYFRSEGDPRSQARHFAAVIRDAIELPPVIDWEDEKGVAAVGVERAHANACAFVEDVEQTLGRACIVYTYPHFWRALGRVGIESPLGKRPLWIAHYRVPKPSIPPSWTKWLAWQWDDGKVTQLPGGVPVDANWYAGSGDDLLALAGRARDTEPAPAPSSAPDTAPQTPTSKSAPRLPRIDAPILGVPDRDTQPAAAFDAGAFARSLADDTPEDAA